MLGAGVLMPTVVAAGILDATWTAPTTNVDGSPLTDLAGYRVFYDSVLDPPCTGGTFAEVVSPTPSPSPNQQISMRLGGLTTGTLYHVAVTAVSAAGVESACSITASATAHLDVSVSPTGAVDFGNVDVGSSADQSFSVTNTVGGTVSGAVSVPAPFSIVSGSPFTLVGLNTTQTVTVRFTPTTDATATANLTFSADGDSQSRVLSGTGILSVSGTSTGTSTGTAADTGSPTVSISTPTSAVTFNTSAPSVTLGGTATDDVGVTSVTWANDRGGSGTATGTTSWTASGIALQAGTNVLTVTALDASGNAGTASLAVTLTDTTDTTSPRVTMTAPRVGATISRTVTVSAQASDDVGVVGVQFKLDGVDLGTEVTSPPYSTSWNTRSAPNGSHVLTAVARDAAGNTATSAPVDVTVTNGGVRQHGGGRRNR